MLKATNVIKQFGDVPVLRGVSVEVNRGEVVAIIGRSGSGKSTLLRCMNHLETIDGGSIDIQGKMGMVFQDYNLFPHLNVLKNLTLAQQKVLGRSKQQAEVYAMQLLGDVGLADKAKEYPCNLSGGQCQRVAIARALALDPDILCFDEPTSALDPQLTHEVLEVIRKLAAQKRTMIVVTHEMNFARDVADRVIYMAEGRVVEEGSAQQVLGSERSEAIREFTGEMEY